MIGSLTVFLCPAVVEVNRTTLPGTSASVASDSVGAAIAFALMGACGLAYAVTRATAVRRTFVTSRHKVPAELALLRTVARRRRIHALAFTALWLAAGVAVAMLPIAPETRVALEISPALMVGVGLVHASLLHGLVRRTAAPGLDVLSHGEFLYAAQGGHLVGWVSAPPRVVARATALPVARLRAMPS